MNIGTDERKKADRITRNIAKSGEVPNWRGLGPFQLHLGLIVNRSQSASCHIANVGNNCGLTPNLKIK